MLQGPCRRRDCHCVAACRCSCARADRCRSSAQLIAGRTASTSATYRDQDQEARKESYQEHPVALANLRKSQPNGSKCREGHGVNQQIEMTAGMKPFTRADV